MKEILLKNILPDGTICYRNKTSHFPVIKLIKEKKYYNSYLKVYYDINKKEYVNVEKLFNNCNIRKNKIITENDEYSKYYFYDFFYYQTLNRLNKNIHPLLTENVPPLYIDFSSKTAYTGINHFLIRYSNIEKNEIFYSYDLLNEFNIKVNKKDFISILVNNNKGFYTFIVPKYIIYKNNEILNQKINILFQDKIDILLKNNTPEINEKNIIMNNIINYFYCMFENKIYIPEKKQNLKKVIIEKPKLFIDTLNEIDLLIK